jgi:hypothetical protein
VLVLSEEFLNVCTQPDSTSLTDFSSAILSDVEKSISDVVRHYFDTIESCSVLVSSGRSQPVENWDKLCGSLLERGATLKDKYDAEVAALMQQHHTKETCATAFEKTICEQCECEDCFTESEPEEESELTNPERKRCQKARVMCTSWEKYPKYSCGIQLRNNTVEVVKNFGLSDIFSVLSVLPQTFLGLTIPDFYLGEEHSTFVAHYEDASLSEANYLHFGFPKVW